jgi:feruloyl esterase
MFKLTAAALVFAATLAAQPACESLTKLSLPYTKVDSAAMIAANGGVPEHCDVKGTTRPSSDSEIKFEIWLPPTGWNGKYMQIGNGGWAGVITVNVFAEPLRRGFAVAGTDDGHSQRDASWAIGHPEKLVDFGYRAVHETSVQAKAIIRAFYGKELARNYFVGCSDGGREALMEAQRYADDFDGIVAGAPANYWSHLVTGGLWDERAELDDPKSAIPAAKLPAIQQAVREQCDALDGVKDGLIEDPRACHLQPDVLLCKGADNNQCLTAPQITALRKIYDGPKNPRTGAQIFPGYSPGVEAEAGTWISWLIPGEREPQSFTFANTYYGQAVFEDPKFDFHKLDFDKDVAYGDEKVGAILNSNRPDLRAFRDRGGKLLQYHGWGDPAIPALSSIEYYDRVDAFLSKAPDDRSASRATRDFYRLFMVPGMGHCGGGIGPNLFGNRPGGPVDPDHDIVTALDRWVEQGIAPEKLIGTGKSVLDPSKPLTRPLCVYPAVAKYDGKGDPNNAASFSCAAPR